MHHRQAGVIRDRYRRFVDRQSNHALWLAFGVFVAGYLVGDTVSTLGGVALLGVAIEGHPLVRMLLLWGPAAVILAKLITTAVALAGSWWVATNTNLPTRVVAVWIGGLGVFMCYVSLRNLFIIGRVMGLF